MDSDLERQTLNLPPSESPGFWIRDTHISVVKALRQRLQAHGVSPSQWYLLRILWTEEGLSQKELSDRVSTTEPTTLNALRLMERNGLVRRQRNSHDRRTKNIYLTKVARELEAKLIPYAFEVNAIAVAGINGGDMAVFKRVIDRIRQNLNADVAKNDALARSGRSARRA